MSSKYGSRWLEREDFGAVTVVRLKISRILDDDTLRDIFELLTSLVNEIGRNQLVVNLAATEMLRSMAIGKLVLLNRQVQAANGRLSLCHLSPAVQMALDTTRLSSLFSIYATEQEAVQSYSPESP
jgi:anti-anti-sigma factor